MVDKTLIVTPPYLVDFSSVKATGSLNVRLGQRIDVQDYDDFALEVRVRFALALGVGGSPGFTVSALAGAFDAGDPGRIYTAGATLGATGLIGTTTSPTLLQVDFSYGGRYIDVVVEGKQANAMDSLLMQVLVSLVMKTRATSSSYSGSRGAFLGYLPT